MLYTVQSVLSQVLRNADGTANTIIKSAQAVLNLVLTTDGSGDPGLGIRIDNPGDMELDDTNFDGILEGQSTLQEIADTLDDIDFVEGKHVAGENLSGHRIIEIREDKAYYADNSSIVLGRKLGLTKNAADKDGTVRVLFFGKITHSGWSFDLALPVFLGLTGTLTQTTPATGYLVVIGQPLSATKLFVDIQNTIKLV